MKEKANFEKFIAQYASEEWIFLIKNYISVKNLKKDERIFTEGESIPGAYFINQGKAIVTSHYNLEHERILRFCNRGSFLGHRALFSAKSPVSAIALTEAELTFIPKDIFVKFIKANPNFSLYLLEFMAKDLRDSEERMKSMIHNEVIVRLSKMILMLVEIYGYDFKNPRKLYYTPSRANIANFVGTTYESVIRNLGKLEELKLVQLDNKNIIIPSEDALKKFIAEELVKKIN